MCEGKGGLGMLPRAAEGAKAGLFDERTSLQPRLRFFFAALLLYQIW